jgi:hypothetical protein
VGLASGYSLYGHRCHHANVMWPIFRANRHLLNDLPALGAGVIERWAAEEYGASVMIMVVRHTFGRHINFNPHLHILVSACGLREADGCWVSSVKFDKDCLMERWRDAVIFFLEAALKIDASKSALEASAMNRLLTAQHKRSWIIDIAVCTSKKHFPKYAARYIRRPPLAEYRFLSVTKDEVRFRTNDHRKRREVVTTLTVKGFVETLTDHVPDHYMHSIHYFGLLAPRSKNRTSAMVFAFLGQQKQAKPKHVSWDYSIKHAFGVNPLIDSHGQRMRWIGRRVAV